MTNPNLICWISDAHLTANDAEVGLLGDMRPKETRAFVEFIRGLGVQGFIDTGDCKDHYGGTESTPELTEQAHDNYITLLRTQIPFLSVNPGAGITALKPILPGNHDENYDYSDTAPGHQVNDFGPFITKFWGPPYHWTADWPAGGAPVRFIAIHTYIEHGGMLGGAWHIDPDEIAWLSNELDNLPGGTKAIICSHPPLITPFGNSLIAQFGGTELWALLAANNDKIVVAINGHRHDLQTAVQDGIRYISGLSNAYTNVNAYGIWSILEYRPGSDDIKFHMRYGPGSSSLYGALPAAIYTPITVAL